MIKGKHIVKQALRSRDSLNTVRNYFYAFLLRPPIEDLETMKKLSRDISLLGRYVPLGYMHKRIDLGHYYVLASFVCRVKRIKTITPRPNNMFIVKGFRKPFTPLRLVALFIYMQYELHSVYYLKKYGLNSFIDIVLGVRGDKNGKK